jgi:Protein of unknown function (DUF2530)
MDAEPPEANEPLVVEPLDVDGVGAITFGTTVWAVAFLVVAVTGHRGVPLEVCGVGLLLGLAGIAYVLRRRAVYRRAPRP